MRQLARLSEAGVERLAGLVGAVVTLVSVRFEQVSSAVGQDDGAIVRAERARSNQPSSFEVSSARRDLRNRRGTSCRSLSDTTRKAPMVASIRLSVPLIS